MDPKKLQASGECFVKAGRLEEEGKLGEAYATYQKACMLAGPGVETLEKAQLRMSSLRETASKRIAEIRLLPQGDALRVLQRLGACFGGSDLAPLAVEPLRDLEKAPKSAELASASTASPPDRNEALRAIRSRLAELLTSGTKIQATLTYAGSRKSCELVHLDEKTLAVKGGSAKKDVELLIESLADDDWLGIGRGLAAADASALLLVSDFHWSAGRRMAAEESLVLAAFRDSALLKPIAERLRRMDSSPGKR